MNIKLYFINQLKYVVGFQLRVIEKIKNLQRAANFAVSIEYIQMEVL